jgi:energy-coupling factor transporter transmembrane protein EcfT
VISWRSHLLLALNLSPPFIYIICNGVSHPRGFFTQNIYYINLIRLLNFFLMICIFINSILNKIYLRYIVPGCTAMQNQFLRNIGIYIPNTNQEAEELSWCLSAKLYGLTSLKTVVFILTTFPREPQIPHN